MSSWFGAAFTARKAVGSGGRGEGRTIGAMDVLTKHMRSQADSARANSSLACCFRLAARFLDPKEAASPVSVGGGLGLAMQVRAASGSVDRRGASWMIDVHDEGHRCLQEWLELASLKPLFDLHVSDPGLEVGRHCEVDPATGGRVVDEGLDAFDLGCREIGPEVDVLARLP